MMISILVPLFLGVPIAVTLGGSGLVWLVILNPAHLRGAGYALWNIADNYILISVPLFLLMGEIIQRSDIAQRFYRAMSLWLRWLPGGLLHANIGACGVFSAVSGSSVATAATIGTAAIPNLMALGYDRRLIFGTLAAGGTLGILIPPSIPLIIYAALVEVSLGRLFIAAAVPGLMMLVLFAAYIGWRAWRDPAVSPPVPLDETRTRRRELLGSIGDVLPVLAIILVVLGGIYFGWATPTEVAALGVLIALVVAAAYRRLTWTVIRESVVAAVTFTSMLMFVIIGAHIFSYALFAWGMTREATSWVADLAVAPVVVLGVIVLIYLVLGMFIDALSMMVLTLSVVFPIVTGLGYDPVWFGVVLVMLLEIGLITPPVGINLYTIQGLIPGLTNVLEVARGALPFVLLLLIGVGLLVAFPDIALWLPRQMY
jgi:tripartite ATP-independent transporter DctM subunit